MKKNNIDTKIEAAKMAIQHRFIDIPVNLSRSVLDRGMANFARNFAQLP